MKVINDGSRTRKYPSTGKPSAPDITIVYRSLEPWCTWESKSTNHSIVQTNSNQQVLMIGKADWAQFAEELDTKLQTTEPKGTSLK